MAKARKTRSLMIEADDKKDGMTYDDLQEIFRAPIPPGATVKIRTNLRERVTRVELVWSPPFSAGDAGTLPVVPQQREESE